MKPMAMARPGAGWWMLAMPVVLAGLAFAAFRMRERWLWRLVYQRPLRYDVPFHPAVAGADRIVVRAGGFDCCGRVDGDRVLFTVTGRAAVDAVAAHLVFQPVVTTNSVGESCMCCGGPGMDWYRGGRRVALTALQHGQGIRWRGFTTARVLGVPVEYGDGPLTRESAAWLVDWLARNGVTGPRKEMEERECRLEERARAREAEAPVPRPLSGGSSVGP